MHSIQSFLSLLRQFFPPDYSWSYLSALMKEGVPQTLEMAVGAIIFSASGGLLCGLYIGARLPGARLLYGFLATVRAIPDLTMAILFVVIVGIGPPSGLLALAVFYGAAMGKVFADLFVSADPEPVEALHATGASRLSVALFALLPLRSRDLLTYGSYEFESKVRACVIVGAVGAGGLATELMGNISFLDYRRTTTVIIVLVLLIAIIDRMTWLVRRFPVLLLAFLPFGIYSAWDLWPRMFNLSHAVSVVRGMLPPSLTSQDLQQVPQLVGETLLIAIGGTAIAAVLALPLGALCARNLSPAIIHVPMRRAVELLRAVPDLVWGLLLVTTVLVGPIAGVVAIALHSTGVFSKLYSESIENVQQDPVMALASTGAPSTAVALFGHLPLAFPPIAVLTMFRFEWNMRAATIMGVIGAGGIGQALFYAQQQFFYRKMIAYVIITWSLVILMDIANSQLRKRWKISEGLA